MSKWRRLVTMLVVAGTLALGAFATHAQAGLPGAPTPVPLGGLPMCC
jgi:hypothetical protein